MTQECEHCNFEQEMHEGDNVCSECGKRTFVGAKENDSKQ